MLPYANFQGLLNLGGNSVYSQRIAEHYTDASLCWAWSTAATAMATQADFGSVWHLALRPDQLVCASQMLQEYGPIRSLTLTSLCGPGNLQASVFLHMLLRWQMCWCYFTNMDVSAVSVSRGCFNHIIIHLKADMILRGSCCGVGSGGRTSICGGWGGGWGCIAAQVCEVSLLTW